MLLKRNIEARKSLTKSTAPATGAPVVVIGDTVKSIIGTPEPTVKSTPEPTGNTVKSTPEHTGDTELYLSVVAPISFPYSNYFKVKTSDKRYFMITRESEMLCKVDVFKNEKLQSSFFFELKDLLVFLQMSWTGSQSVAKLKLKGCKPIIKKLEKTSIMEGVPFLTFCEKCISVLLSTTPRRL